MLYSQLFITIKISNSSFERFSKHHLFFIISTLFFCRYHARMFAVIYHLPNNIHYDNIFLVLQKNYGLDFLKKLNAFVEQLRAILVYLDRHGRQLCSACKVVNTTQSLRKARWKNLHLADTLRYNLLVVVFAVFHSNEMATNIYT